MTFRTYALILALAVGLGACSQPDRDTHSTAREAGKEAYKVAQETKAAAKKAGRELRQAGHDAREGWNEAKREAQSNPKR